jgi:hypothetical protein
VKKPTSLFILIALTANCTYIIPRYEFEEHERQDPIVISERVGEAIDAEERKQFDLFTEIAEFKDAQFYSIEGGGYIVEIMTNAEKLAAVNRDQDAIVILGDYIDRYEAVSADRAAFENKWGILAYDTLGIPITENEVKVTIARSRRSARKAGILSCVVPSLVFAGLGLVVGIGIWGQDELGDLEVPVWGFVTLVGFAVGSVLGLVYAPIAYFTRYRKNVDIVVRAIKEARKPRLIEF